MTTRGVPPTGGGVIAYTWDVAAVPDDGTPVEGVLTTRVPAGFYVVDFMIEVESDGPNFTAADFVPSPSPSWNILAGSFLPGLPTAGLPALSWGGVAIVEIEAAEEIFWDASAVLDAPGSSTSVGGFSFARARPGS